ncbi:hypothetical protein Tco_0710785 [Tanacetum coccineum]
MGVYKHNQLKSKSYEEIQKMFDNEVRRVNTFIPMDSEEVKSKKETEESSKGTEDELKSDKSKKAESNSVMSDSEHSTVTYTSVSFPVEDDSDIGSPGVDGPPIMPEDPYAYRKRLSVLESDPEEDDEDPEEDPADYPVDGDDDDDDEDEDEDKEEEEEHPALADSIPPVHRMTARISIRDEPSVSLPPREEVERLLALTTPPPSPLTPLSSPLPQIPSPLLPIPSPPPNSPTHIKILESCLPLWKRVHFASLTPSREVGESSAAGAARQDRPNLIS